MKIVLEGERPWSWNKMYAGVHWTKRKEEADRVHGLLMWKLQQTANLSGGAMLYKMDSSPLLFKGRVDISVVAYFKNRPLDPDNITSKFYIDGLVGEVIEDDTREFVRKVTTQSEVDKENPRVEIIVEGCK